MGHSHPQTVSVPPVHEGVGNALRSAFGPRAGEHRNDLQRLLDKIR